VRPQVVRSHQASGWTFAGVIASALLLAILMGLGAATGQKLVIVGLAGLAGALAVLAVPVRWTFWTMIIMSFVVVGPAAYFLKLGQLQWLPSLVGAALYLQVLVMIVTGRVTGQRSFNAPAYFYFMVLLWLAMLFSSVLGGVSLGEAIMASRYYIFVWGALMVFFVGAIDATMIDRVWRLLLLFTTFQLPMVLYQYFFIAKKRATGEIHSAVGAPPWDAIIGTFPGNDTGGGNSAAMAMFVLIMMVLAIALWRDRHMKFLSMAAVVLCGLGSIALAEVKAVVLLIPVALALYYRKEVLRHPVQALLAITVGAMLTGLLLFGYQKIHYDNRVITPLAKNANASMVDRIENQLSPEGGNEAADKISRVGAVVHWWDQQGSTVDIHRTLFGHGIGTTQQSNLEVGTLVRRYGELVDRSSLLILLWETGAVGLLLYAAFLATGALLSMRLAKDQRIPQVHRTYLGIGSVALVLLLLTLPYKPFAVRLTSIQLLIILILGQAFYWMRTVVGEPQSATRVGTTS
jgi:hypothetical protein